jgi:CrcB protein
MTVGILAGITGLGALGAVARAGVQGLALKREKIPFFAGTLIVNLSGAFALGLLHGAGASGTWIKLAGAGFLGAFTTFSGWMLETERLNGLSRRTALGYLLIPLAVGVLVAWLGNTLGQQLFP